MALSAEIPATSPALVWLITDFISHHKYNREVSESCQIRDSCESKREAFDGCWRCDDARAFSSWDRRKVAHVVGDDVIGVTAQGAMVKRIVFRIGRIFTRHRFYNFFASVTEQIDKASGCVRGAAL